MGTEAREWGRPYGAEEHGWGPGEMGRVVSEASDI